MNTLFWRLVAWVLSRHPVADFIIRKARQTPYTHIPGYMGRWWLLNAYEDNPWYIKWLPSVRVHHILRADLGRYPHNHPWDARTIILRGFYMQEWFGRKGPGLMIRGDTGTIGHMDFHHITFVPVGGVWTLFITYRYRHTWGFLVPWREMVEESQ